MTFTPFGIIQKSLPPYNHKSAIRDKSSDLLHPVLFEINWQVPQRWLNQLQKISH